MPSLPIWPNYTFFQWSEIVRSDTNPYFNLQTCKWKKENDSPSSFFNFLWNLNFILTEKVMTIFPRLPVWDVIQEPGKTITSLDHISDMIVRQDLKLKPKDHQEFISNEFFFSFWNITIFFYSEHSMMTCLEQQNTRIQSSDTKCYETSSQKDRKDISMTFK